MEEIHHPIPYMVNCLLTAYLKSVGAKTRPRAKLGENMVRLFKYWGLPKKSGLNYVENQAAITMWFHMGLESKEALEYAIDALKRRKIEKKREEVRHQARLMRRRLYGVRLDELTASVRALALARNSKAFYRSDDWKKLRYAAFERYGNHCCCCGRSPRNGAVMHVDHIWPRSLYPQFALNIHNLQILCDLCNMAKSNKSAIAWLNINYRALVQGARVNHSAAFEEGGVPSLPLAKDYNKSVMRITNEQTNEAKLGNTNGGGINQ